MSDRASKQGAAAPGRTTTGRILLFLHRTPFVLTLGRVTKKGWLLPQLQEVPMPEISREDMIEAAKRAAKESSIPLTCMEFIRRTGISKWQINRLFPEGRWTELRTVAGIDRHPMDRP